VVNSPVPSSWSVSTVNTMLSPQLREQFRKTKLCAFHKKLRCELGAGCPFAHSQEELHPAPDLAKTKLCYNYFRGQCNDSRCKFAHGSKELRSVWVPYSPGVWFFGPGQDDNAAMVGYPGLDDSQSNTIDDDCNLVAQEARSTTSTPSLAGDEERVESLSRTFSDPLRLQSCQPRMGGDTWHQVVRVQDQQRHYEHAQVHGLGCGIALRVRGTFMEAMEMSADEDSLPAVSPMRRSWSEGDLQAFREAMEDSGLLS